MSDMQQIYTWAELKRMATSVAAEWEHDDEVLRGHLQDIIYGLLTAVSDRYEAALKAERTAPQPVVSEGINADLLAACEAILVWNSPVDATYGRDEAVADIDVLEGLFDKMRAAVAKAKGNDNG